MCDGKFWRICAVALVSVASLWAWQATAALSTPRRAVYVVSDLHLNVGRAPPAWHALEDFRWPNAFRGLLKRISETHPQGADVVVAGDFLELWQHPTVTCTLPATPDCGCTIDDMKRIISDVVRGHAETFEHIAEFLDSPGNRFIVTPGNHDAALMIPEMWKVVTDAVPRGRERFVIAPSGTWMSDDFQVAVEHGHQQTFDVNYFPDWNRRIVTKSCDGTERIFRPWGENFVQSLYNQVEEQFPIIDNLVPDSAGVALYSKYREQQGRKAEDIARFVIFNILQTSPFQKGSLLSLTGEKKSLTDPEVAQCRACLKSELVFRAEPGVRDIVQADEERAQREKAKSGLRAALDQQVAGLDMNTARMLCERVAMRENGTLKLSGDAPECRGGELSMMITKFFDPNGTALLRERVTKLAEEAPNLSVYVFGHTHEARERMAVRLPDGTDVAAFNTGAFQRLIDETRLFQLKTEKETVLDMLARVNHDDLKSCYAVLTITYPNKFARAELRQWFMAEGEANGKFLHACSDRCSAPPANCKEPVPASRDEIK